jgi:hypothetical protein
MMIGPRSHLHDALPAEAGGPAAAQVSANIAQIQTLDGDYWNALPRVKVFMFRMSKRPAFSVS